MAVLFSGCYDASQSPKKPAAGGGPDKSGPSAKPMGLVILDVIKMSVNAVKTPGCSLVPSSLAELREAEAQARIKGVTAVLEGLADNVRIHRVEIDPEDCASLNAIDARAEKATASDTAGIAAATRAKPAVHVRMVLWNGDRAGRYPPWTVYSGAWASYNELVKQRFGNTLSVTHFAVTAIASGYVSAWYSYSSRNADSFLATTVEHPSADDVGLKSLNEAALKSSEEFGVWLARQVEYQSSSTGVVTK